MNMKVEALLGCLLALIVPVACADPIAPPVTYPIIAKHGTRAEDFVPSGWKIEVQKSGDLNGDGLGDLLFVLRMDDPKNIAGGDTQDAQLSVNTNPRMLVVAFGTTSGTYQVVLTDHRFIPRNEDADAADYFGGANVVRGTFQLNLVQAMTAGSWFLTNYQYTFRYQEGCFRLIGTDTVQVDRADGTLTKISSNLLTQRTARRTGSITSDRDESVVWSKLKPEPLKCLQDTSSDLATSDPTQVR